MNYKTILLCAVLGASMQTAHGMDIKQQINNLIAVLQEEHDKEVAERTNGMIKLEGLMRSNLGIGNQPAFQTVMPKIKAFVHAGNQSQSADISLERAREATLLADEFETALQKHKENENSNN